LGFRHLGAFDVEGALVSFTGHAYLNEPGEVMAWVDDALGFDLVDMQAHFPDGGVIEVTTPTGDEVTADGYIWRVEPTIGAAYDRMQALITEAEGAPTTARTTADIIARQAHFEEYAKWHQQSGGRRYAYAQLVGLVAATLALGFVAALPWPALLAGNNPDGLLRFGLGTTLLLVAAGLVAVGGIMLPIRMISELSDRLTNPERWAA
jgi:hypothetical protein